MGDTVIRVENLGKKYTIGHQGKGYGSFREMLTGRWQKLWSAKPSLAEAYREEFWALQDVNFEVKRGDRLGIIGRNGAGKSTLLKILSRITEPTTGRIAIRGRVASLLEVGTGFHPELTGRENIFLNGVILGMKRREIQRKFDEIVAFAEVEKFLDTPVKHYSSGMYVRLAFAVAAHLDPEILVVDEVLAVGDAAFQKKCLGKMEDVAEKEGRTVLFVSHTMSAIAKLCQQVIWLAQGSIVQGGAPSTVIGQYLLAGAERSGEVYFSETSALDSRCHLKRVCLLTESLEKSSIFDVLKPICLQIEYVLNQKVANLEISLRISNSNGIVVCSSNRSDSIDYPIDKGLHLISIKIPKLFLVPGTYSLSVGIHVPGTEVLGFYEDIMSFEVKETGSPMAIYEGWNYGVVLQIGSGLRRRCSL
ncbi:MAG: ABC transporter ATP-binding protein [Oscillatoriales cyanobacterium SM2_1_8]|nr:ABC transporter ATP-binding protein [Oscillatoriales cyanobacterium SM2_1_8]